MIIFIFPFSLYMQALENEKKIYSDILYLQANNEKVKLVKKKRQLLTLIDCKRV
jgi:hypothetical protein